MASIREQLIAMALTWEERFAVMPSITSAISEYDAAILLGMSEADYEQSMQGRTSVSRGYDFAFSGVRYQVKACRPSGKKGSPITRVPKATNYEFDKLIYIQYKKDFSLEEAWLWDVAAYRRRFDTIGRISPADMRAGESLIR